MLTTNGLCKTTETNLYNSADAAVLDTRVLFNTSLLSLLSQAKGGHFIFRFETG